MGTATAVDAGLKRAAVQAGLLADTDLLLPTAGDVQTAGQLPDQGLPEPHLRRLIHRCDRPICLHSTCSSAPVHGGRHRVFSQLPGSSPLSSSAHQLRPRIRCDRVSPSYFNDMSPSSVASSISSTPLPSNSTGFDYVHTDTILDSVGVCRQLYRSVVWDREDCTSVRFRHPNWIALRVRALMGGGGSVCAPGRYFFTFADACAFLYQSITSWFSRQY